MKSYPFYLVPAVLLLCLTSLPLWAADHPCKADIGKYCKDIKPGEGRMLLCLRNHSDKLSSACKYTYESIRDLTPDIKQACRSDMEKFCDEVSPGEGRYFNCLKKHKRRLAHECRKRINEFIEID